MLRFGIIGTNKISSHMADAIRRTEGTVATAVYSRAKETGNAFAEKEGISHVFTDLTAFLSSDVFDAVYIASPNACHYAQAMAAMQCGKDVLLEKPAAESALRAEALFTAATTNGCILMEAMRPLYTPIFRLAKEALSRLGCLRSAHFSFCQYSSRYDRFLAGEIPNAFEPSLSNAALLDIGIYPVAMMHALLGAPRRVRSRSVFLRNGFEGRGTLLADYGEATSTADYSKIDQGTLPSVITGENGSLIFDSCNKPRTLTLRLRGQEEELLYHDKIENDMVYELAAFLHAVETRDSSDLTRYTVGAIRILDEVRRQNGILFPNDALPL